MRTRLCDLLGIDLPIIAAPFGPWDSVELAAAVCRAGGLGSLGTAVRPVPELRDQWRRLRARTDRPFAINHVTRPFDEEAFAASLDAKPAAISFHLGDPGELVARAHDAGIRWIQQVMDVDQAREAVRRGVDVIVAQGGEAGGHSGFVGTMALVPQVVDVAGATPVVAAGGIADGRGLAAALNLGAQAVSMGTRFLCSTEARASRAYKERVVRSRAEDTLYTTLFDVEWPEAAHRVLRNKAVAEWEGAGRPPSGRRPGEGEIVGKLTMAGVEVPTVRYSTFNPIEGFEGDMEYVALYAGESCSLVNDIRPADEIVKQVAAEATAILRAF